MNSALQATVTRLLAVPAVTALVGARVYAEYAPESATVPYLVVQATAAVRAAAMGVDAGVLETTLEVTCVAGSAEARDALGEAVRGAVQRYRGTVAGVTVQDTFVVNQADGWDEYPLRYPRTYTLTLWTTEA